MQNTRKAAQAFSRAFKATSRRPLYQVTRELHNKSFKSFSTPFNDMSLFPRFPSSEFGSLFRLLDDYDLHRSSRNTTSQITAFTPKFDVRELNDKYELSGELPGLEQKDINIEFVDPQTITISGRTEREYSSGTPPSFIEGGKEPAKIESGKKAKKATVEDEGAQGQPSETQVQKAEEDRSKYWVSERSVGEFYRSFQFPGPVAHDDVKASLKNGILNILVPKATAPKTHKVVVE